MIKHISKIIIIVSLLLLLFSNNLVESQYAGFIQPDEYDCLKNIYIKYDILNNYVNETGYIRYCLNSQNCINGSISYLQLLGPLNSTVPLNSVDITCFPNLKSINLNQFVVTKDLYYYQLPYQLDNFVFKSVYFNFNSFDQVITNCKVFYVSFTNSESYNWKLSQFINVSELHITSYIYLDNDIPSNSPTKLISLYLHLMYYPDFSFLPVQTYLLFFNENFQISSLSNHSKIGSIKPVSYAQLVHTLETIYPISYFETSSGKIDSLTISARFEKPTSMINGLNLKFKKLTLDSVGSDFNVDGKFPFITNPLTSYAVSGASFIEIPPTNIFSQNTILASNGFSQNLPNFTGNALSFYLSLNSITGTIDPSWCSTKLEVRNNKMTGKVPSCFACYFSEGDMYYSFFGGNTFTNLFRNNTCPTFAPQVLFKESINGNTTLEFTGIDIGFYPEKWYLLKTDDTPNEMVSYEINKAGKNYTVIYNTTFENDYFYINFSIPLPSRTIPFPKIPSPPIIRSVQILNNQFIINGKYFSSYMGHYNQIVKLITNTSSTQCSVNSTSAFLMDCNIVSLPILQENSFKLLRIQEGSFNSRVLINTADGTINNIACSSYCQENQTCNLSNGICESIVDCPLDCSSHGVCNYTSGKCTCDANFQGDGCNSAVLSCTNDCTSSLNGICDTFTGVCKCNTKFEGIDCSLIKCLNNCTSPSNGVCDKTTGTCKCTNDYQSSDCSVPFIPCLNDCTGINGQCNNRTGICSCDIKYTTQDCSIPNQVISSISPSTTIGGNATFSGWFGNIHTGLSLTIGGKQCEPILSNSSDEIVCNAPSGTGINIVVLTQNNIVYSSKTLYKYLETVLKCPNDCTNLNQGTCDTTTGNCNCINGYTSYDCSIKGNGNGNGNPPTNTTVDPSTGGTNITNQEINFQIYLKSLYEIDFNGQIVKEYSLQSNWTFNKTENNEVSIYTFSQPLLNSPDSTIVSTVEEITIDGGKQFSFAGSTFKLDQGSIKYSISINNYKYSSNLNTLKLDMISLVAESSSSSEEDCNTQDTEIDTHNVDNLSSFNYIKISKDNKVFSGRFINKLLSDGKSTFYSTSVKNDSNSITISLNLAHCENCVIDPDFSVLITSDFKSNCNDSSSSKKWIIPIAVCVPIVGIAIIGTISYLFYKKRYIERPFKLKMKALNSHNK